MSDYEGAKMLIRDYGPVVPWLLSFVGWLVVSRDNDRRELRREARENCTRIVSQVKAIEDLAHEYYRASGKARNAKKLAGHIKRELRSTDMAFARLRATVFSELFDLTKVQALRTVVTGSDFENANRQPVRDGARFVEISVSALDLIDHIEQAYQERFATAKKRKQ